MKTKLKYILALAALFLPKIASAGPACSQREVVRYNTAQTIQVCLSKYDSTVTNDNEKVAFKTDATFSAGDVKINYNVAGTWNGETNIGTLPTDRGGCYSQPLSTTETSALSGYIMYVDQSSPQVWIAHCVEFYTAGDSSAFFPEANVNVTQLNGNSTSLADLKDFADDGYDPSTNKVQGVVLTDTATTAGTCSALGATAKSDVNAELVDVLRTDTGTELSACPTAAATLETKITYIYEYFRHRVTSTVSAQTLYKDNGTTPLCSSTMSDDTTTFERGEFN